MKRILLATAVTASLTIGAIAADLPSRTPPALLPPPPLAVNWTGIYAGGQVGFQWANTNQFTYSTATGAATAAQPSYYQSGVVGGGHVGYNYQINQFVLGIEGDIEGTTYKGSAPYAGGLYSFNTTESIEGSIRGRVGVAGYDRALFYVTGGVAFAPIKNSYGIGTATVPLYDDITTTHTGWTVGGGFEYAFNPHWSARLEYRYTDFGNYNDILAVSPGGTISDRHHETDNAVRLGFSYKFDMYTPLSIVIAKY